MTLAGVPVRSVNFLTPNMLDVVSDAGPARVGSVQVTNPDHTASALTARFEYYQPTVARINIDPPGDVLAPGMTAQFTAHCFDQFDQPLTTAIHWEATIGAISATGLFTAPNIAGKGAIRVTCSG